MRASELADLREAKRDLVAILSARGDWGVIGVGVGIKRVCMASTGEGCITVYVGNKRARSQLSSRRCIPKNVGGSPTDVVASPWPQFAGGRPSNRAVVAALRYRGHRGRTRPLVAGVSCSNLHVSCGTLGYFCRKRSERLSGAPYLLSCGHVLAGGTSNVVVQAAPGDGGTDRDRVATVEQAKPLKLGEHGVNRVDAAIARLHAAIEPKIALSGLGAVTGVEEAVPGMEVVKSGRTTGITYGRVAAVDYDTLVPQSYRERRETARFVNQIRVEPVTAERPFARFGDSGALVVTKEGLRAVGMYFAGPADGSYGLLNPIDAVLDALDVELITTST